nr:unnamed protein product [Spirometra erinaceieuropaei]
MFGITQYFVTLQQPLQSSPSPAPFYRSIAVTTVDRLLTHGHPTPSRAEAPTLHLPSQNFLHLTPLGRSGLIPAQPHDRHSASHSLLLKQTCNAA